MCRFYEVPGVGSWRCLVLHAGGPDGAECEVHGVESQGCLGEWTCWYGSSGGPWRFFGHRRGRSSPTSRSPRCSGRC